MPRRVSTRRSNSLKPRHFVTDRAQTQSNLCRMGRFRQFLFLSSLLDLYRCSSFTFSVIFRRWLHRTRRFQPSKWTEVPEEAMNDCVTRYCFVPDIWSGVRSDFLLFRPNLPCSIESRIHCGKCLPKTSRVRN